MNLGPNPLYQETTGQLTFQPEPILPTWLFSKKSQQAKWNFHQEQLETVTKHLEDDKLGIDIFALRIKSEGKKKEKLSIISTSLKEIL